MSDAPNSTLFKTQLAAIANCIKQDQWEEARTLLAPLQQQFPTHPHVLHLHGLALQQAGELQKALEALSQAVAFNPDEPTFHLALGVGLKQKGAKAAAAERFYECLRLNPHCAEACFYLGDLNMDQGQVEEATRHFTQAVTLQPLLHEAWINLGLCQKSRKELPEALESFQQAIRIAPNHPKAHVNLAMTHLIMGNYPQGWQEYEWRFQLDTACLPPLPPNLPRWQGESLTNKIILIVAEQGYGDILQFIRFAQPLKKIGATVFVTAPTPLVSLLQNAPGVDQVQNHLQFAESLDYYIPLLSIPALLGTTLETIPHTWGYLTPDPQQVAAWQPEFSTSGFKVGLIWEGKPLHQNDPLRRRACTLADLAPLADIQDLTFFSLQKGPPNQQALHPPDNMNVYSLEARLTDFSATAAVMAHLDLIITIDTATAHLAGALGKPVWTMLPLAPDWRWGLTSHTTPWYDSMRLFRQTVIDQWAEPIAAMVALLEKKT